jgi:hypothetical protein
MSSWQESSVGQAPLGFEGWWLEWWVVDGAFSEWPAVEAKNRPPGELESGAQEGFEN